MTNLNPIVALCVMIAGAGMALYCGIGSLFVLGSGSPAAIAPGSLMVVLAVGGVVLVFAGLVSFVRSFRRGARP